MPTTFAVRRQYLVVEYSDNHGFIGKEAPNQTFKRGNLISNDANGLLQATPAGAGALVLNVIANQDAQNLAVPTRKTAYVQTDPEAVLEVTAGGTAATVALIKRGAKYGYAIDATTGLGYLDLTNTTNQVYQLESTDLAQGAIGDTNVRVYAKIIPAVTN